MNSPTRILCVDDERNVLRALERIFLDDDYEIVTASSGEEGLQLLNAAEQVQVVISDFRMPGMNGVEFLKEVFKTHPETIRIVLSGYADTAAVVAAVNEGKIYKFIPKPWNDDELRVTVAKALETFAIQRRNQQLAEELHRKNQELSELNAHMERLAHQCNSDLAAKQHALLQAERILEHLPVGVVGLDADGIVLRMNREAALILQVGERDAVGKKLPEALPAKLRTLAGVLSERTDGSRVVEAEGTTLRIQAVTLADEGEQGMILTVIRAGMA